MDFEVVGSISSIEPVAVGAGIRDLPRFRKQYGKGSWKKLKGFASVRLIDGTVHTAELHWYEAHGIGKKELKIKFPLLD
ncbi:hypothetical protein [Lamprocystis purpurea]|jgi:hypothetical protein|uniref:hypothetical protein n=1 Tax=Lamprocystis purpurea TaxID=61598 RepID=UPI0009FD4E6B|nr:hypothetical protein [Lamprocystis purpurea]